MKPQHIIEDTFKRHKAHLPQWKIDDIIAAWRQSAEQTPEQFKVTPESALEGVAPCAVCKRAKPSDDGWVACHGCRHLAIVRVANFDFVEQPKDEVVDESWFHKA